MVDSAETSTTMDTLMTEVMIRKHLRIRRKVLPRPLMAPATPKKEANKEKELSSRFLQPQASKVVLRITTMARKRRLRHPAKKSDLRHRLNQLQIN